MILKKFNISWLTPSSSTLNNISMSSSIYLLVFLSLFLLQHPFVICSVGTDNISSSSSGKASTSRSTSNIGNSNRRSNSNSDRNNYNNNDDSGRSACHCEKNSVQELIKISPVILKALGANIFTDDDLTFQQDNYFQDSNNYNYYYNNNNNNKNNYKEKKFYDRGQIKNFDVKQKLSNTNDDDNQNNEENNNNLYGDGDDDDDKNDCGNNRKNYWITLTPETIYKGTSTLKITRAQQASLSSVRNDDNVVSNKLLDKLDRYEGQLNATLEPLKCFDSEILNLLPTDLIVFGKLISNSNNDLEQQLLQQSHEQGSVLKIFINGLHRWSPQFEHQIWKYLGWDDWSDFTLCSVTCGKGVQQRFRRCLLDNPITTTTTSTPPSLSSTTQSINNDDDDNDGGNIANNSLQQKRNRSLLFHHHRKSNTLEHFDDVSERQQHHHSHHRLSRIRMVFNDAHHYNNGAVDDNENVDENNVRNHKSSRKKIVKRQQQPLMEQQRWKKKRKTKGLTTLSCEGYNIEQRNCNMFECGVSEDISDLLKFYKKSIVVVNDTTVPISTNNAGGSTVSESSQWLRNAASLREWKNYTNFTIMITLKVKIPPSQSTIFSLRNFTHNLYLDQSENGLKFFQERDDVTEMLPIKFDLFDNRWHQIAISIQNGDFITVFVDCLWTNSFVVSKRLFALPYNAEFEIGHEFNGELQQLSILNGNQEKLQCSNVRTSINEVKRYIIDTFIDDYGN